MADPFNDPSLFDCLVIDGVTTVGVVTLSGHERAQKWDVKDGDGQDGGSTTRKGSPPTQFTASFYLVNDPVLGNQIEAWDAIQRLIESTTAGPEPVALPVEHPDLARNGITEIVNGGIGGMEHDGKGGATVVVKLLEFRPPKPKGGSPTAGSNKTNDPNAAAKATLNALVSELEGP
jgi:hypothetical protein